MQPEYYFNADFDIGLGLCGPVPEAVTNYVRELSLHYIFAAPGDGSIVLHYQPADDFFGYIADIGLAIPQVVYYPEISSGRIFTPFGWDRNMLEMSGRYKVDVRDRYPSPDDVKKVNGKIYSHNLSPEIDGEENIGKIFCGMEEIRVFLKENSLHDWVLKSEHGNSGSGHLRVNSGDPVPENRIEKVFKTGQNIIVEPWQQRHMDLSSAFGITRDGKIENPKIWEVLNGDSGSFMGIRTEIKSEIGKSFEKDILDTIHIVGPHLFNDGYFGPVCIDSYIYRDNSGNLNCRKLVEINARLNMSIPAHRIRNNLKSGSQVQWILYPANQLTLPDRMTDLSAAIDSAGGWFITSPLSAIKEGLEFKLKKVSVLFYGRSAEDISRIEGEFLKQFKN